MRTWVWSVALVAVLAGSVGCSSLAIPMVAARRLNDRGATYQTTPSQAESAVKTVVQEMGGEVRWVQRGPERRGNVQHSVADSMSVHGTWGKLKETSLTETNFIVDINTVPGHAEQMMIRIGSGDFGNSKIADEFQRRLAQRLPSARDGGIEVAHDRNVVREVVVGDTPLLQPATAQDHADHIVHADEIVVLKPDSIRFASDNAPILRNDTTPKPAITEAESEALTEGVEVILTEQEAIERGLIPDPAKN